MSAQMEKSLKQSLFSALSSGLFRTGLRSGMVRILSLGLTLLVSVFLARVMGAEGLGLYALAMSVIGLIGVVALMGMPSLILRETAQANADQDWATLRGLWFWGARRVLSLSAGAILLMGLAMLLTPGWFPDGILPVLALGLPLVLLTALAAMRAAALQGLGLILPSQIPDALVRPVLLLAMVGVAYLGMGQRLTPQVVIVLNTVAVGVCFVIGAVLLIRARPEGMRQDTTRIVQGRAWNRAVWTLALIAGAQSLMANADILMLGWWKPPEQVGYYRVATSGAGLCAIGLGVVAGVVNPRFAALFRTKDQAALAALAPKAALASFALAVPVAVVFLIWGSDVLRLVYGAAFTPAAPVLAILAVSQLVNTFFGSCIGLLNMTGHERSTMISFLTATAVNIALNAALIPPYGMEGAAYATLAATVIWNGMLWITGLRVLKVDSSVLGLLRRRR